MRRRALKWGVAASVILVACVYWFGLRNVDWGAVIPGTATDGAKPPASGSIAPSPDAKPSTGGNTPSPSAPASPDRSPDPSAEPSPDPSTDPSSEPGAATEPDGPDDHVRLAIVGDVITAANVLTLMQLNGYDYPFTEAAPILAKADFALANLEAPLTDRGTPMENKKYIYRAPPDTVEALKQAGFDYFALANNHTMDYGWEGLSDTMAYLDDAGLKYSGAGSDDKEAFSAAMLEHNGLTIGVISVSRVLPVTEWKADKNNAGVAEAYSTNRAVAAIEHTRSIADIVVVMVHWGEELKDTPNEIQTTLGHAFVDAGADLVIGSHPHTLQGFEAYKGKWIAYSLGNFVFPGMEAPTEETGVLQAQCDKSGCSLQFEPMVAKLSKPVPMAADAAEQLFKRLSGLSISATVDAHGRIQAAN